LAATVKESLLCPSGPEPTCGRDGSQQAESGVCQLAERRRVDVSGGMHLNGSVFVSLIYNAALLLVMVLAYDLLSRNLRANLLALKLLSGLVLGIIAIAVMVSALRLPDGVIFDTRSVVLSMGSLFYGTIPGLIAGLIAGVYRVSQGGGGVLMGVLVIATSVSLGILWRQWRRVAQRDPGILELYVFGLTVHAVMLLLTSTLPDPIATLRVIAIPVIIVYPLASVLVGLLMIDSRRHRRADDALKESQERFVAFADQMPGRLWIRDADMRYLYVNQRLASDFGMREEELLGKRPEELWDADTAALTLELCERARRGEPVDLVRRWPSEGDPYYRSRVFVIPDAGQGVMFGGLVFDVTLEHAAEEEMKRHAERLQHMLEGTVLAISHIVERRDPYTAGHQRRVAELACAIAEEASFRDEDLEVLRLAALLHDIGKVSVPAEILGKPRRLNDFEYSLIKEHSQIGCDIIREIEFGQPVADIVLQHHERLDGSGYPLGVEAERILPAARVLAVADVFEAMISHRPYRPAHSLAVALEELRRGSGSRYDSNAVACCEEVIERGFSFSSQGG
jgi:putative nucleotidyltransferase with HDIG domain/PAS domain S-box-containing protein